jgi:predicted nucleotidyltransferase
MDAYRLLQEKREEILEIAAKHGASRVRIFGSVARGEATTASDFDFLVRLDPDRSLLDQVALQHELQDLLGGAVDILVEGGVSPYLERRIDAEAVPL